MIPPGSMTTTSMPNGLTSIRRQSLMASRANLVAWYQAPSGVEILPPIEVMLTIVPECCCRMCGRTS